MIVVLMGYMGSGKSTIGKRLANVLNYDFLDLDNYISAQENSTITDIFNEKGEIYFRKKETDYLNEVLNSKDDFVLALGGGTPCYGYNLKMVLDNTKTKVFYLKLTIPKLVDRLFMELESRPLISHLNSKDDLTEFIGKHLFERTQFYSQAEFIINSDEMTKQDVIENILMRLI